MASLLATLCSVLFLYVVNASLPWSYDNVNLWADFGFWDGSGFSDDQAAFVANHYKVISIEKCTGSAFDGKKTEEATYEIAKKIRKYASTDVKILFYWNVVQCYSDCYDITQNIINNQSMFLTKSGQSNRPYYDMTKDFVREWWVNSLVTIIKNALEQNVTIDGVFADGMCTNVAGDDYNNGIVQLMNATKNAFAELNTDLFILGNGLIGYGFEPDHCTHVLPYIDGICMEHFGAFEEISSSGKWNPDKILMWHTVTQSIMNGDYGLNKSIFVKAWIGPETQPIDGSGPSWPVAYEGGRPPTHAGRQNASSQLLAFPLAAYLCGIYDEYVYFSYAWWYLIKQGWVPCPENPNGCDCPLNWYPEFEHDLGRPLAKGYVYDTYKCNRSFEYAHVYVDLNDSDSANIEWYTHSPTNMPIITASPTSLLPTSMPSASPTVVNLGKTNVNKKGKTAVIIAIVIIVLLFGCIVLVSYARTRNMKKGLFDEYERMETRM